MSPETACPPCPFPAFRTVWPVIGGYRVVAHLGGGGYGMVYRAEGPDGAEYAIKLLKPRVDPSAARRLLREARATALLRHPRLVHCYDVGIELGHPYLVLEYLPGGEVTVLRYRYPQGIPRGIFLNVALDAAEGLAALHAAGLCHRDIKPANLLFDAEGRVRLADFGLVFDEASDPLTHGTIVGTPSYMAPELFQGNGPSPQTDLYALGATLYCLATGRPPHDIENIKELASVVLNQDFPDPRIHAPWLDQDVAELIMRLGAKHCHDRYASAREVIEDLQAFMRRSQPAGGLQTRGTVDMWLSWSAYVYHDGEADDDLYQELRRRLHQDMQPIEIGSFATAVQSAQPLLVIYDAWRWSDAVVSWTRWIIRHAPHATVVVLLRQASDNAAQTLRQINESVITVPYNGDLISLIERVFGAISTATEQHAARPGMPPLPSVIDIALTRVVVLSNRIDCGNPLDVERFARSCAALAGQLHNEQQFYACRLALAMMHCVQEACPADCERLRRLLVRAARLLEYTHRGSDFRWERLDVLVIDDDPTITLSCATVLQRYGVLCRTTHDAASAIAEARRRLPQVVICDIAMPGQNGFEFVEQLRALPNGRNCPVLFITGFNGLPDFLGQAPRTNCDIMGKPIRWGELWLRVLVLLGESRWPRYALIAQHLQSSL